MNFWQEHHKTLTESDEKNDHAISDLESQARFALDVAPMAEFQNLSKVVGDFGEVLGQRRTAACQ